MNTQDVIETVQNIFIGADNKDWDLCLAAFAGKVVLDYTSLNGGEPSCIDAEEIIETWRNFLPRFKSTHHQ
ncbi:MAG TPA: nuclear transport factor 2 family protein, partial [Cytophagales bacterium]|nr:nuclear transport factor 2 family protein [Cytophagales bacterium]